MNRKAFALSWGRKIFFGMGWTLISIIGLTYLQSKVVPQTPAGWLYFVTSFIGHYGLMVSILYFIFYYPIILVVPSYYVSRFWSLFLIMATCLILFFDSYLFSQYRFHANNFILDLLFSGGIESFKALPTSGFILSFVGVAFFSLVIWVRGEWLWRSMQARFSNPVKNWYLGFILICLGISHGMHIYGDAHQLRGITKLAQLFPLYIPSTAKSLLDNYGMGPEGKSSETNNGFNDFYYPAHVPVCKSTENTNILFIIIDKFKPSDISPETTPGISHLMSHAVNYTNHFSGGMNSRGGLFSLFYSLPTTYWSASKNNQSGPMLMDELKKRQYEMGIFSSIPLKENQLDQTVFLGLNPVESQGMPGYASNVVMTEAWKKWITARTPEDTKPFFGTIIYDIVDVPIAYTSQSAEGDKIPQDKPAISKVDELIKSVVDDLYAKKLLSNTMVVITGNHASENLDKEIDINKVRVPLITIFPEKNKGEVNEMTSHYDIVPTVMSRVWECGKSFKDYSYGSSLLNHDDNNWLIVGSDDKFGILDFQKGLITSIQSSGKYHVTDLDLKPVPKSRARESVVFEVLNNLTRFYKK